MRTLTASAIILIAASVAKAITLTGNITDCQGAAYQPVNGYVRFLPKSTPLANGGSTVLDVPRSAAIDTNGNFACQLVGGIYVADFGIPNTPIRLLAPPNDTNTYTFNQCAAWATNVGVFVWTNMVGYYPGANMVFRTNINALGQQIVFIDGQAGGGGAGLTTNQAALLANAVQNGGEYNSLFGLSLETPANNPNWPALQFIYGFGIAPFIEAVGSVTNFVLLPTGILQADLGNCFDFPGTGIQQGTIPLTALAPALTNWIETCAGLTTNQAALLGITTNYPIPGGLTLYITNGVIMGLH